MGASTYEGSQVGQSTCFYKSFPSTAWREVVSVAMVRLRRAKKEPSTRPSRPIAKEVDEFLVRLRSGSIWQSDRSAVSGAIRVALRVVWSTWRRRRGPAGIAGGHRPHVGNP